MCTVLLGMNNPLTSDPRFALVPFPVNSSGWNLFKMLQEVSGAWRYQYVSGFERLNLLDSTEWSAPAAERGAELWRTLRGRRVLVLGQGTVNALRLVRGLPCVWYDDRDVCWCEVPHPSGRNRWYNEELHRLAVGYLLEEELVRGQIHS